MKRILLLGIATILLSGCMTLTNNKSVLIPPSDQATLVESFATAHCQDFIILEYCTLDNQIRSTTSNSIKTGSIAGQGGKVTDLSNSAGNAVPARGSK